MSEIERSYLVHMDEGDIEHFESMRRDLPSISAEQIYDYWLGQTQEDANYDQI